MTVSEVADQTLLAITTVSFAMWGISFLISSVRWAASAAVTT